MERLSLKSAAALFVLTPTLAKNLQRFFDSIAIELLQKFKSLAFGKAFRKPTVLNKGKAKNLRFFGAFRLFAYGEPHHVKTLRVLNRREYEKRRQNSASKSEALLRKKPTFF
jgi:hypothetical protein